MGRTTSALLVALAVVVTASLLVLLSGNSGESGIVSGPVAEGTVGGTLSGLPINSSTDSGYTPMPEGTVRLWDLGQAYGSGLSMAFVGWADRADWTQIAYGETPESVANDVALEGTDFFFNITWRPDGYISGPVLYRKPAPSDNNLPRHNLLYRGWATPGGLWAGGANLGYIKVLKNTPQEVLVQSAGKLSYRDPRATAQVIANYGVRADKPWLEITPVSQCTEVGMHGESRFIILPEGMADGTDYAYDALNDQEQDEQNPYTVVPENSAKMLLDFVMDDDNLWALMITPADPNSGPDTYLLNVYRIRRFMLSNQIGGYNAGWSHIGEGDCWRVVSAPYAFFMGQKIVIGHLRVGYWHYQKIASPVTQGTDLTINWQYRYQGTVAGSPFTTGGPWWPMYPGQWRMVSRINGQYHTQQVTITQADVGNSEFTFHSPATGNLEYVLFYMYDRTDQTPPDMYTVMDIYRGGILDMTAEPVGRHVFYNNSSFDGNNPAAGAADDNAIATDKTALLPGQTATFANYTSYNRGINGIMVDIPDLPTAPEITASDFTFKVGNPPPVQTVLDANFDIGTDGFGYVDDTFRSTSSPAYADGERIASGGHSGGALQVAVGGIDMVSITNGMSGGWSRSFTLAAESNVTMSLWYKLTQTNAYEPDEYSDALVSIDGQLFGTDGDRLVRITGDGEYGDPITTGWVHVELNLGTLSAGSHTLKIGAYNNKKDHYLESTEMLIDDVKMSADPLPPIQTLLDVNFDSGTDGFGYADDTFRSTNSPAYADGERIASGGHSGGALRVAMGGIDMVSVNGMSGGWGRSFTLAAESNVSLSLWYKLTQTNAYEPDEYSDALVSVDGQLFGTDGNDYVVRITGDGEYGDPITTGWVHAEVSLGVLSAGSHTLKIGAYNNKKDHYLEATEMIIDDVKIATVPPPDWADAAAPTSVTVRRGAGVGGSDRVTVIWADGAIQKEWLQVTVKANLATLLASPDVFYFGNAVGDSGNSTTDTAVNTMDEMRARLDPHKSLLNPADIENPHDYNRSGVVSTMDEMIARLNNTTMLNDLNLITAP